MFTAFLKRKKEKFRPHLIEHFKHIFLIFKQYYTHFHTLFHP